LFDVRISAVPVYNYKYHVVADPPHPASGYKGGSPAYAGGYGPLNFGHQEKRNGHETQVKIVRLTGPAGVKRLR
jgi:hypothetical protein